MRCHPRRWQRIRAAGGEERALAWVLEGMPESGMENVLVDIDSLVEDLVARGILAPRRRRRWLARSG